MSARRGPIRIVITTGDADGIGTEVSAKALAKIKARKGVQFYFWRSPRCPVKHLGLIDRHFKRVTVSSWAEALKINAESSRQIIDINSNQSPPIWVETTAKAGHFGHIDAMVTAPLSKIAIAKAGLADIGHTDILQRVTGSKDVFMGFIGDRFNVLLATGHIPIAEVANRLTPSLLGNALRAADCMRQVLDKKLAKKPLGLLALNPHAGEEGVISSVEASVHRKAMEAARENGLAVEGPLVPDAAFFKGNWSRYSVFIASYHDQGLIPFKMIHGQESGIHLSMGLPFIRTSVDHGTAKDIFGQNKADARSMRLAIDWAIKLCRSSTRLTF